MPRRCAPPPTAGRRSWRSDAGATGPLEALGGILVGAGVAVLWITDHRHCGTTAFGGSYAPLEPGSAFDSSATYTLWTVLWTGGHLVGALLVVAGLLVLAVTVGRRLGRRGVRRWSSPSD